MAAHLYGELISIGVILAAQSCCEPVWQSNTEQWGSYSALNTAAMRCCCSTAQLYEIAVLLASSSVCEQRSDLPATVAPQASHLPSLAQAQEDCCPGCKGKATPIIQARCIMTEMKLACSTTQQAVQQAASWRPLAPCTKRHCWCL